MTASIASHARRFALAIGFAASALASGAAWAGEDIRAVPTGHPTPRPALMMSAPASMSMDEAAAEQRRVWCIFCRNCCNGNAAK